MLNVVLIEYVLMRSLMWLDGGEFRIIKILRQPQITEYHKGGKPATRACGTKLTPRCSCNT